MQRRAYHRCKTKMIPLLQEEGRTLFEEGDGGFLSSQTRLKSLPVIRGRDANRRKFLKLAAGRKFGGDGQAFHITEHHCI